MCPTAFEPSFEEWKPDTKKKLSDAENAFEPSFEEWKRPVNRNSSFHIGVFTSKVCKTGGGKLGA